MERKFGLVRAWACYWIMQAVEFAASPFPRSPAKARILNAALSPFAPYGFYWSLYSNPNLTAEDRKKLRMERRP